MEDVCWGCEGGVVYDICIHRIFYYIYIAKDSYILYLFHLKPRSTARLFERHVCGLIKAVRIIYTDISYTVFASQ